MPYEPPKNIWEVDRQIKFNTPLAEDDPRYVHTEKGRGDFSLGPLLKTLGVDPRTFALRSPPQNVYALFCGHRGCGKSTELRRLCARLHRADRFFVVFLDATVDLDPNNLRYADVLLALAKALSERLQRDAIRIDQVFLSNLESWFSERIETNALKTNSTYKDELRKIVQNSFSQFADAFNQFIDAAESADKAAEDLSTDYKRILDTGDYQILYDIDHSDRPEHNSERIRYLLYNLALLEYNNFWRRSHPAVRRLEGYRALQGA